MTTEQFVCPGCGRVDYGTSRTVEYYHTRLPEGSWRAHLSCWGKLSKSERDECMFLAMETEKRIMG